ncbi:ATP-dependent RNA helicase HrpA [Mycetocola saprophilus]|uniref:ATP-dependent RNA helicase HrpA n=1 Tax=Mycetocola saprophilus TaxID=76636 RepID=UPI003BF15D90
MSPVITFPAELPVSQKRSDIADAIRDHQVVIVAGATGSGKTTQLPKIALELGRESIGHTQPRRIAARTIAERIAEELGEEVGETVGYQVRFTDKASASTKIKLMTDGILLNEIHHDRLLKRYDTIIIDEAHERSLNIDFLLGYLKQLLPKRPDLKVIITSATIDPESFSKHFNDAPIIEVSGRTYPVEIRFRPLVADENAEEDEDTDTPSRDDRNYIEGIIDGLDELARESLGDVLVFLSGEAEIRDAADALRARYAGATGVTEILPLYGRLSAEEQHRVFRPGNTAGVRRRVILATNVAETSLTVPGIKYVIDAGTARISRYSVRAKIQRLPIEAISQASANQRSGRTGRTSPGIAIRLYSEEDFTKRPEFTEPEVLRTNLAAVILQMVSLGLGDIAAFPFLQAPEARGIKDGLDLLTELGAITQRPGTTPKLTRTGRDLARLPIDPRFARMVLESKKHGTTREVMAIVAALTIQDPRERPVEKRQQADEFHNRFADPTSDFLSLLGLWNYLEEKQKELSSSAFRRMCKAEFLNYLRVREWQDVYRQLRRMASQLGLSVGDPATNPDGIHRSILSGLLSQIGIKDEAAAAQAQAAKKRGSAATPGPRRKGDYVGARQARFVIFPGSALIKKQPDALMAAELVETSRLFARTVAKIDPAWAEAIAPDLCKRSYSEPHWEKTQGSVVAYEKVTLYGVPIIPRRRVQYARIDLELSRDLFIRHALVQREADFKRLNQKLFAFDRQNAGLRRELAEREERTRRRDILFDDEAVYDFYNARIPAEVADLRGFEKWWREAAAATPKLLTMRAEDLLPEDADEIDEGLFPPTWSQGDQTLKLRYRFEPGTADDGVTVMVPLALLPRLSPIGFDWQVPGLRAELVTALLKSLPKHIRRNVVPAADWAARLLADLPTEVPQPTATQEDTLTARLAIAIKRAVYIPIEAADFELDRVPDHLKITFRAIDERGRTLSSDKDLTVLQSRLATKTRTQVAKVAQARTADPIERRGLTSWDFDELPRFIDSDQGGHVVRGYPALVDRGDSVEVRIMATEADQLRELPGGVRRLLQLQTASPVSYVQNHLTAPEKLALAASPYQNTPALFDDCLIACIDDVLQRVAPGGAIFMRAEFEKVRDRVSQAIMNGMFETVSLTARILTAAREADKALGKATSLTLLPALTDMKAQRAGLVFPGFVSRTGLARMRDLPRYLSGITHRASRLADNANRDRAWQNEIETAQARFTNAGGTIPLPEHAPDYLVQARWMLEEFRISLFAQHLGTSQSVSLQRITKALDQR